VARAVASGTRADAALLTTSVVFALIALALPARMRDPFAAFLRENFVAPLIALEKAAELGRDALVRHDAQTAARDSVALRALMVPGLQAENERLRRALGLGHQLAWGFVPAEALHSHALGEEYTMTLTAGSRAGVRPFSPVVAPEGLVGMVQTVDPTMSLAIMWAHPDFRVSAMSADGGAFGIVKAHLGTGSERYLLELSGVQLSSALRPGTPIVSSGVGGVYPRGIPVGTVIGEVRTSEGWARTYLLRPAVKPADAESVLILEPRRGMAGVQSVWAGSQSADSGRSATRRDTTHAAPAVRSADSASAP
jgi:rod shape-determining protein MreC